MYSNLLNQGHWMLTADIHSVTPGIVTFCTPFGVGARLNAWPWNSSTGLPVPSVLVDGEYTILQRGTDIGSGIPHATLIPEAIPAALWCTALSGSKSEFGVFHIRVGQERGALAVAKFGRGGLNLNCSDPVPLPNGIVIARSTVQAWMSPDDCAASWYALATDMVLQGLTGSFFGMVGKKVVPDLWAKVLSFVVGSPLGASATNWGMPANLGSLESAMVEPVIEALAHYDEKKEIDEY